MTKHNFLRVFLVLATLVLLSVGAAQTFAQGKGQNPSDKLNETRETLKQNIQTNREAAKKQIETARQTAQQKAETLRAELKEKLNQMKDERKRQIAERLTDQLDRLNERWTTHFSNILNQLENVLAKIELRSQKAETNGSNISSVKTAIELARVAIKTGRDAIAVQAAKVYTAKFESEEKLKDSFKAIKEQLRQDLAGLRDGAMKNARKAVQDAFQALSKVPRVNEEPAVTSTPNAAE